MDAAIPRTAFGTNVRRVVVVAVRADARQASGKQSNQLNHLAIESTMISTTK